jgi:hypothetical protein
MAALMKVKRLCHFRMVLFLSESVPIIQNEMAILRRVKTKRHTFTEKPISVSAWSNAKIIDISPSKPEMRSDEARRFAWALKVC